MMHTTMLDIPFNRPFIAGREIANITQAIASGRLSGDGAFTKRCSDWLEAHTASPRVLLTHSCTGALEMAAVLLNLEPGDEVILPSFTFVSTANAFILRGAVPVFVDIRRDTLNIDPALIEAAITPRTRAIVAVHYGGVSCDMDAIMGIAARHNLRVVEDAAQGLMARYKGRALGSIGHLGCLSFHDTKNIIAGEGGALLVNDPRLVERAEIIREKGTNRRQFLRGEVDKYTWVDVGSSYLPSELTAAFLFAQLQEAGAITARRLAIWDAYHEGLAGAEAAGLLRRPTRRPECSHNAHLYYVLLPSAEQRPGFIDRLKEEGIGATFHYVPLHSSPFGQKVGRVVGSMDNTDRLSACLVRLPLWVGLEEWQAEVIARVVEALDRNHSRVHLAAET